MCTLPSMRTIMCVLVGLLLQAGAPGPVSGPGTPLKKDFEEAVAALTGAASIEELSEDELERYRRYESFPLRLNQLPRSRLLSSGLLSQYRVASLLDYRSRYGDVLSLSELSAVDGFGEEFVSALAPFISLESSMQPGALERGGVLLSHDAVTRGGVRWNGEDMSWNLSSRYSLRVADRYEAALACKFPDKAVSFYASYEGRRHLSRLVVGAFNCRFGQGLAMWSGFSLGSSVAASTVSRNPGFIAPYRGYDYSSSMKGAGATFCFSSGRSLTFVNAFVSHPGVAGLNSSWFWRTAQVGVTGYVSVGKSSLGRAMVDDAKLSADFRWNLRGVDLFGETSFDALNVSPAFLLGVRGKAADGLKLAALVRYYDRNYSSSYSGAIRSSSKCTDEHGVLLVGDWNSSDRRHKGSFSVDMAHRSVNTSASHPGLQSKSIFIYEYGNESPLNLSLRVNYRFRDYEDHSHKLGVRTDLRFAVQEWQLCLRLEGQYASSFSGLTFLEVGRSLALPLVDSLTYRHPSFSLAARLGLFHADNWTDRLYCYERDAPGNFNVPALYGRGMWISCYMALKLPAGLSLYLRAATTQYPAEWFRSGKPEHLPKTELKLQLSFNLSHRTSG